MPRKNQRSYETENKIFPTRLREAMDAAGMNQNKLAKAIRVRRQTISNYTLGQSAPDCEMLAKIAIALNVSTDYLVGLTDIKSQSVEIKQICEYTGLSEQSVVILSSFRDSSILEPLNTVFDSGSVGTSFLVNLYDVYTECKMTKTVLDKSPDEIRVFTTVNDNLQNTVKGSHNNPEVQQRKNSLELAMYKFSRTCDRIPDLFGASKLLDEIGEKYRVILRLDNGGENESSES